MPSRADTIRSVEAFIVRLPKEGAPPERYRSAPHVRSIYPSHDEILLVRIATDHAVGWGEALTPVTPEAPAAIVTELLAGMVIGTVAGPPAPLTFRMQETMRERGHMSGHHMDAVAAVDIALWDLWGRTLGQPVHALLGGAYRDAVPVYLTSVPGDSPEEKARGAVMGYRDGHRRMKLHLSMEPAGVLATVDAVQGALDGSVQVAVDTHWVHDVATARPLGRAFDERGVWFFEAPLAPEDIDGHQFLAAGMATPVAVGEAMRNRFEFAHWATRNAMQIAQPDIGRTGISEGASIATALAAHHVPIAPHHSMATSLAYAAGLHVAASAERVLAMEFGPGTVEKSRPLMDAWFMDAPVTDGAIALSDRPGLGVEVDEAAVWALAGEN
ncbi:mandelate racemase/muconate lactonizing enzyme family protein [Ruania alkalisoli]|uniref:Mandelate racemase/muconate lactonizing enzyme family protein n=1 Tax=Ruania alkalisoli TaxID=2779775 RepID=A0A7M1SVF9_9MICO|nr:mandelate racemase/muconate lactonizing enzyme family protein [Ruania alkalisoli]QOR71549.1 mandelate racemase/muconate lactonizing enzyme family protein [Ruania alkalisoli]